jgi:alanine racemase
MYVIAAIKEIVKGTFLQQINNAPIETIAIDSRKITFAASAIFFALSANRRDGHNYIQQAYQKGVRNFVVSKNVDIVELKNANVVKVKNTLTALQQVAIFHREQFSIPVIGITGSNGKTIVKEWLYQLLHIDNNIVRSPKSYNSQIGVPLSIWNMVQQNNLAIFEAGISTTKEMQYLEKMIQPTIGILTNIGNAHSEGFINDIEKLQEKLILFNNANTLIYNADNLFISNEVQKYNFKNKSIQLISWGKSKKNTIQVKELDKTLAKSTFKIVYKNNIFSLNSHFTDDANIENLMHCVSFLLIKEYKEKQIATLIKQLQPVAMRLEQKKGINGCIIINDSYSNDLTSLQIALDYLEQQKKMLKKTVVLTDLQQTGKTEKALYNQVAHLLAENKIDRLIGIGPSLMQHQKLFTTISNANFFESTNAATNFFKNENFKNEIILFKGARTFQLENFAVTIEEKVHQTTLEISMEKLIHNVKAHQNLMLPTTQIMAIVKAFGYGNGAIEVATTLQNLHIHYLAVAYADEGVELRKASIHLPIMVMNMDAYAFSTVVENDLEPEIYSIEILKSFLLFAQKNVLVQYPIHLKLDTGMHRLGLEESNLIELCSLLKNNNLVRVQTIFSHLVGSEAKSLDGFTKKQNKLFTKMYNSIEQSIGYTTTKHIANSGAIERHPNLQHQMVRLGIGMYGVTNNNIGLQQVCTLKTTIAQIKFVKKGETIGYNRKGKLYRDSKIATVRIGYADGYNRQLGNGIGKMIVNGTLAPTIGNICMDMTMIDVTDITNVHEGDYVIIFGESLTVQNIAEWCKTIPYEILTGISQRVKRIYYQ